VVDRVQQANLFVRFGLARVFAKHVRAFLHRVLVLFNLSFSVRHLLFLLWKTLQSCTLVHPPPSPLVSMGLGSEFKQYVRTTFPDAVLNGAVQTVDGVVLDVMVFLHLFKPAEHEDSAALRLAQSFWRPIRDARVAALCFDSAVHSPEAKQIEWRNRRQPERQITVEQVERMLSFDVLDDELYADLISMRKLRLMLCEYIVNQIVHQFQNSTQHSLETLYIFGGSTPRQFTRTSVLERPDLQREMHGEADVSGVLAAFVMQTQHNCERIKSITVDTDWVLTGLLHSHVFKNMIIELSNYNRKTGFFDYLTIDIDKLSKAINKTYNITCFEFGALALTRGCDYLGAMVKFCPKWPEYMNVMAKQLAQSKTKITPSNLDTGVLHATIVAASDKMNRAKLTYTPNDGTLARLAWSLLYYNNVPLQGGAGMECIDFGGWVRDGSGRIQLATRCEKRIFN